MTCRRLFDPLTLSAAALAVTTVATVGTTIAGGLTASAQADAEAEDLKAAATRQRVQAQRAIRDEKEEQRQRSARIIALASARGNVGTSALARSETESALRIQRLKQDATENAANLRTRAGNVRDAGSFALGQSIFSGGAELVGGSLSTASKFRSRGVSTGRLAGDTLAVRAPGG